MVDFFTRKREFASVEKMRYFHNLYSEKWWYALIIVILFFCMMLYGIFTEQLFLAVFGVVGICIACCGGFCVFAWFMSHKTGERDGFVIQSRDGCTENPVFAKGMGIDRISGYPLRRCFPAYIFERLSSKSVCTYVNLVFTHKDVRITAVAALKPNESFVFDDFVQNFIVKHCNEDAIFRLNEYLSTIFKKHVCSDDMHIIQQWLCNGFFEDVVLPKDVLGIEDVAVTFRVIAIHPV